MPRPLKRPCVVCGGIFQPIRASNDKCSDACRRIWHNDHSMKINKKVREFKEESYAKKKCSICGKEVRLPARRVTCSHECAEKYYNDGVHYKKKREIEAERRWFAKKKEKKVTKQVVIEEKEIPAKLKASTEEVTLAIERFREEGGKIKVLPTEPDMPVPNVNLKFGGWDWEALMGLGKDSGAGKLTEYVEPLTGGNKNGNN